MRREYREILQILGYLYLQHAQPGRALAFLLLAARDNRDDPELTETLAYAFLANGDAKQAHTLLERLDRREGRPPDNSPRHLLMSRTLLALGETERARELFRRFAAARRAEAAAPRA